jgi:hypothetical protein
MSVRLVIDHSNCRHIAGDAAVLVEAFEGALGKLGLADHNDPAMRMAVANHLVTFAKAGEYDAVRLRELTLEAIRVEQSLSLASVPDFLLANG